MHDRLQQKPSDQKSAASKQSPQQQSPQSPQPQPQQQQQHQKQQSDENNEDGDGDGDAVHLMPLRETSSWPLHTNILVPLFADVEPPSAYSQVQYQKQTSPLSSPSRLIAFIRKHSM